MQIRSYNRLIIYGAVIINVSFILALLLVPYLSSIDSFADPLTSLETSISISSSEAALLHMYPDSFGTTSQTINVSTNNSTGYTLLFSTDSNSTDLVNISNDSLTIPTISLRDGESSQTRDTFTSGYGYSTDNTNYIPVPGFTTDGNASVALADVIGQTDIAGDGTAQLSFGVKIPADTSTGVYQNRFQISAIANDVSYEIKFNSNVENETVTNLPETSIGTFNGDGIYLTLSDQIPNRYPYTFLGWSEDQVLTDDSVLYQPGDSILLDPTKANSFNLYAQWEFRCHPNATTISNSQDATILSDAICMQDMNLTVAKSMTDEVQYTLYDKRDQKPYFIAMLKDGNVWMTQNLDLGDAEKSYTLTSDDTDLEDGQTFVLPPYASQNTIAFDPDIYINEDRVVLIYPIVRDGGDKYYVVNASSPSSTLDTLYDSLESCIEDNDAETCRHYHVGNYYSINALTVGTITEQQSSINATEVSTSSICPAGWRLITSIDSGSTNSKTFQNLVENGYNGTYDSRSGSVSTTITMMKSPIYFTKNGYYYSELIEQENGDSSYLPSITLNDNSLYLPTDTFINARHIINSISGSTLGNNQLIFRFELPVRCVARDNTIFNLTVNYHDSDGTPLSSETIIYNSEEPNPSHIGSEKPNKNNHLFIGWATSPNSNEIVYKPGDSIHYSTKTAPTSPQTLNLYAVWEESINLLATISTMQEMTPEICDGTTTPTNNYSAPSVQLTDTRDGKKYWVAKLADGNCWMQQNLDLGSKETAYTLTPQNSDVAKDFTLPTEESIIHEGFIDEPSFASNDYSIINGLILDPISCQSEYDEEMCEHHSVGSYYNYYATTAGTGGTIFSSGEVSNSICPLGWTLPRNTGTSSFQNVINRYNLASQKTAAFESPLYWVLGGIHHFKDAYPIETYGTTGTYQTRTGLYPFGARNLSIRYSMINAENYYSPKINGLSIRCIARKNTPYTLSFNNNGGTGSPSALNSPAINTGHYTYTIPLTTPTRSGYTFAGWNTLSDGTGENVHPGDNYTVSESSTLYATWNYSLSYDANGGIPAPNSQTKIGGSTTFFEISSIVPTNHDKLFLGWSTDPSSNSPLYLSDRINVTSPNTTLYAIWGDSEQGLVTIQTMQEMNGTICETTPIHYSKRLTDIRDGKQYWVAKLADGNCWMTQNLDLGGQEIDYILTPEDSDVSTNFTLPKEDTSIHFDNNTYNTINFRTSTNEYVGHLDSNAIYTTTPIWSSLESCVAESGLTEDECHHYHTGAYYNWYTATAGSGTYESVQYAIASSSICPAGWRLPLGRSSASSLISDYSKLLFAEGVIASATNSTGSVEFLDTNRFDASPLFFVRSGMYFSSVALSRKDNTEIISDNLSNVNNYVLNWESTPRALLTSDTLYGYQNAYIYPQASASKSYGATVRCVARSNETYTLSYNANGGENAPISQTSAVVSTGHYTFTLNSSIPTRSGYSFAGWNTKADGTGKTYQPNAEFTAHDSTTLYATWNYTLHYNANGGENAPESTAKAGGETVEFIIDENKPTKENSYFWGWSLSPDSESGDYAAFDRITVNSPETTLYAIWNNSEVPLETITYMQDINSSICRETPNGYSKQLIDKRDGKSYWVTKYADGNCWMSQNLDIGDTEQDYLLTSEDSDVKEDFLLTKKDSSAIIDNNVIDAINYNDGREYIVANNSLINFSVYSTAEECASNEENLNEELCKHYHSGNQYNFYTATAGSITSKHYRNTEANSSICPAGWQLPTAFDNTAPNIKSFTNLYNNTYGIGNNSSGSLTSIQAPFYVVPIFSSSEMATISRGSGYYWTASVSSLPNGRAFVMNSNTFSTQDVIGKATGANIRCVARNTPVDYNITYNYQDGSTPSETKTLSFDGETRSLMIDTEAPEREGYNFVGWGTSASDTTPSYMPGDLFEDFYTNSNMPTNNQSLELYAIWEESTNLLSTISTMQEMTPEICNGTTTPTTTYGAPSALLTDTRDGKKYWVAKLADGKCWMTQNLGLGDKETSYTLTPDNSDVATEFVIPKEPTTEFSASTYNTINFRNNDVYAVTSRLTNYSDIVYKTREDCDAIYGENNSFCQHYHVGGSYNWYTATAGNGVKENTTDYDHINTSICPAGWRLPYGKANNATPSEFSTLLYDYGIIASATTTTSSIAYTPNGMSKVRLAPLYFTRIGYYSGQDIANIQSQAYYFSAHNNTSERIYILSFDSGSIRPSWPYYKYYGYNLRCVARESETYTLYYDANGGNNAPISQSKTSSTGHVEMTLNSIIPERPGYTFKGYGRNKYSDSVEYSPGDTIVFANKNLRLYAIWEKTLSCHPNATSIGNIDLDADIADDSKAICMQDMNTTVAKSMTEEQQYRLIDIRDNTTYYVSRLKDGNVWMTQNLDLGNNTTSYTLTPNDSDVKENYTLPTTPNNPFNNAYVDQTNFRDPGDIFYITSGDTTADLQANAPENCNSIDNSLDQTTCYHYHVGNYYNWHTATAGTGTSNIINNFETAESSICPSGWRLPQGLSTTAVSSDYPALLFQQGILNGTTIPTSTGNIGYKTNGFNAIRTAPLFFVRSGYYSGTATGNAKIYAYYWTSSNWNSINTLGMQFYNNNILTNYTSYSKALGRSIRCLARNTAVDYTINYHQNDDTDTVTSETVSYSGNGLELKVKAKTPTREGYLFLGWGTSASDATPTYIPGQLFEQSSITDMITENQALDLYAIWEASATNLLATISTMQEMTPAICEGTTTPATNYGAPSAQLTDTRDGKKYWVSKLADGQCWMTQNLDLGDKETSYTLTPEDSDVPSEFVLPKEDSTIQFNTSNYDITNFRDPGNLYQTPNNKTNTDSDWVLFSKEACESLYNDTSYCEHHHSGNYYNWYTATAGTGDYNYKDNTNALSSSICPAGWRLPKVTNTSTGNTDFSQLLSHGITTVLYKGTGAAVYTADGFRTVRNSAFFATRSGYYGNNSISNNGSQGYYLTSSTAGSANAYTLYINTSPYPNYGGAKYLGRTVRCIARTEESYTLSYNANGGSNAPISQTSTPNARGRATFTLSSNIPSRNDFTFVGWNTRSDGSGTMLQPGDEYVTSSITLYAIWSYTLNYNANGGDSAPQGVTANDGISHVFQIDPAIPTKTGSLFLGWSEDPSETTNLIYADGVLTASKPNTTLYAVWGSSIALDSIDTMQEMTSGICANTPIGYSRQLEDIRDRSLDNNNNPIIGSGTKYFVAKLGDGHCWMTQNLDFAPNPARTYYGDDGEHIPDTDIGFGTSSTDNIWAPTSISTTAQFTTATANQYIYRNPGEQYYVSSGTLATDTSYTSKSSCEATNDPTTCSHYHAGNYYNWYTAVAGSGKYGTGSGANYTSATNSICPYGWRLPFGRTSSTGISEFGDVMLAHNAIKSVPANSNSLPITFDEFDTLRNHPLYFTRAGYYNNNSLSSGGSRILFWTSTNVSNSNAYGLYLQDSAYVAPNSSQGKHQAFNIRCVAR